MLIPVPLPLLESPPLTGSPFPCTHRSQASLGSPGDALPGMERAGLQPDLELESVPCRQTARTYPHRDELLPAPASLLKHSEGWIEGGGPYPPPTPFCSQLPLRPSSSHPVVSTWQPPTFLSELSLTPLSSGNEEDALQGHNDPLPSPWFSSKFFYIPFPFNL